MFIFKKPFSFFLSLFILAACGPKNKALTEKVHPVDPSLFITESLVEKITTVQHKLSDGSMAECYKIVVKSVPHEHKMGPWCPRHINDSKEKAGIWFENGKVYDLDGHFIANIKEFYADEKWKLYNDDGTIKVTLTQEQCEGAAKPDVEDIYNNYCVECQPTFYAKNVYTYYIPVQPKFQKRSSRGGRGNVMGLAFNGVNFDPPAPTEAILKAHTLAPLDDCGGHVNPHTGYHYHAATGCTKEVAQTDTHSAMIGYAMDGFGIYAFLDKNGEKPMNLDPCHGHEDSIRGYHYHAGEPGHNEIIGCLNGAFGEMILSH